MTNRHIVYLLLKKPENDTPLHLAVQPFAKGVRRLRTRRLDTKCYQLQDIQHRIDYVPRATSLNLPQYWTSSFQFSHFSLLALVLFFSSLSLFPPSLFQWQWKDKCPSKGLLCHECRSFKGKSVFFMENVRCPIPQGKTTFGCYHTPMEKRHHPPDLHITVNFLPWWRLWFWTMVMATSLFSVLGNIYI